MSSSAFMHIGRASLALAGSRQTRGAKPTANDSNTDIGVHASRVKSRHSTTLQSPSILFSVVSPPAVVGLLERHERSRRDQHKRSLPPQRHSGDIFGTVSLPVGGEISADTWRDASSQCRAPECTLTKRHVDWDSDDVPDNTYCANPAKRLRTGERPDLHVEDRMPTYTVGGDEVETSSDADSLSPSSPSLSPPSFDVFPSSLSKWQAPRTSPLGPRTSPYHRRSRECSQPRKSPNKSRRDTTINTLVRNLYRDIRARNPEEQSVQWCEDLLVTNLKNELHPTYNCPHVYHPSDPEYDEEWSDETWSDEEWSDSDDMDIDLPPSLAGQDQPDANVTIVTAEEQSHTNPSDPLTFVHWTRWHSRLPSRPHMVDIHSPLVGEWDSTGSLETDIKEYRRDTFASTIGMVAVS
ncbi:hypothetical protein K439DRAFT_1662516 [Ramaria rubella]|nr:hypothetical protein K439DRAFT_1662516 [Ramaria rubella]